MLKYSKIKFNLGIYIPILYCVFICLFYRSDYTNINVIIHKFYNYDYNLSNTYYLSNVAIYNLPEAMWVFSLTLLTLNYKLRLKNITFSLSYIPLIYVWIAESLQLINITNGTFDLLDLLLSSLFWLIAYFLLQVNKNKINNTNLNYTNLKLFIILFSSALMADTL